MRRLVLIALLLSSRAAPDARAQTFPPVTTRAFSLDMTVGTVLGSIRTIGLGGASVALVEKARLWGNGYRVRVSFSGDFARDYGNGGLSIGFW